MTTPSRREIRLSEKTEEARPLRKRRTRRWVAVGALLGAATATGTVAIGQSGSPSAAPAGAELVLNGSFEQGLKGWRSNDAAKQPLGTTKPGRLTATSAVVSSRSGGAAALNDSVNTVARTVAGDSYRITAWVKAPQRWQSGQLRIREVAPNQAAVTGASTFALTDTSWNRVVLDYRAKLTGAVLDLNVVAWNLAPGGSLQIDDVSMVKTAAGTPAPAPTQPPAPVPTATATKPASTATPTKPSATATPKPTVAAPAPAAGGTALQGACKGTVTKRGLPSCGAYVGAAIDGNAAPEAREKQLGSKLAVRRTYYRADQVDSAVATAKKDLAEGRLPWISFKLPTSWENMNAGQGDAWAKDIAARLDKLDGPVWVAFHHEPEGDGDIKAWVAMQKRLSPIMRKSDNVAFTMIVTGWNQFFSGNATYAMDNMWPGDGLVDVLAVDVYNFEGAKNKSGQVITADDEMKKYYDKLAPWAKKHGVAWGVAESGYTDTTAAQDPAWVNRAVRDLVAQGGVAYAYFDSELNSTGSWPLDTAPKISAFGQALKTTVRLP